MCVCVCVCWVMYWGMRGKMVKIGENRLWEAFCPLHMHTITQAAVRARPQAVIPQPTPIALPDCLGAPYYLCGLGFFIYFLFSMTYKYMYVYHQRYLYIHCCTSNYIKREPQSNPLWSSGELLIPQTWAVCFGLFKLPTHSTTKDKVRPLHLFLESKVRLWLWG